MSFLTKWKILNSQYVLDNQWCRIRKDRVKLSNDRVVNDFYVNVRPDIVLILAVTQHEEFVFVRQYRHGVREILLELPGGSFDPNVESSLAAAERELREETGYIAQHMTHLATLYDNPVKDTNKIHVFIAENAQPTDKQQLDTTENIEIVCVPMIDVMEKLLREEISVSGTIAALFLGLKFLS